MWRGEEPLQVKAKGDLFLTNVPTQINCNSQIFSIALNKLCYYDVLDLCLTNELIN